MRFAIIPTEKVIALGYDPSMYRKSVDGSMTILHLEFADTISPALKTLPDVSVYDHNSPELAAILNGPEWTPPEGVPTENTVRIGIIDKLKAAIQTDKDYLAITAPTSAQNTAQVKALTRQTIKLIRFALNVLDAEE